MSSKSIKVRWWGHAGFQITANQHVAYVDLYMAKKYIQLVGIPEDKADLFLATHHHADHFHPASLKFVKTKDTKVIAPEKCKSKMTAALHSLLPGESLEHKGFSIQAVQAYNITRMRSPGNPYHPKGLGVGYLITVNGKTIYHAGDTDLIPEMKDLEQIDLALLPTGGTYTMDNQEAVDAALLIQPRILISMHRWDTDPRHFKSQVEAKSNIKVLLMTEGDEYRL